MFSLEWCIIYVLYSSNVSVEEGEGNSKTHLQYPVQIPGPPARSCLSPYCLIDDCVDPGIIVLIPRPAAGRWLPLVPPYPSCGTF